MVVMREAIFRPSVQTPSVSGVVREVTFVTSLRNPKKGRYSTSTMKLKAESSSSSTAELCGAAIRPVQGGISYSRAVAPSSVIGKSSTPASFSFAGAIEVMREVEMSLANRPSDESLLEELAGVDNQLSRAQEEFESQLQEIESRRSYLQQELSASKMLRKMYPELLSTTHNSHSTRDDLLGDRRVNSDPSVSSEQVTLVKSSGAVEAVTPAQAEAVLPRGELPGSVSEDWYTISERGETSVRLPPCEFFTDVAEAITIQDSDLEIECASEPE